MFVCLFAFFCIRMFFKQTKNLTKVTKDGKCHLFTSGTSKQEVQNLVSVYTYIFLVVLLLNCKYI